MTTKTPPEIRRLFKLLVIISVALILGSLFWRSLNLTYSLAIGLLIGGANLYLITQIVRILLGTKEASHLKIVVLFLLKILILFGIIGLLILKGNVSAVPFLVGVLGVPMVIFIVGWIGI